MGTPSQVPVVEAMRYNSWRVPFYGRPSSTREKLWQEDLERFRMDEKRKLREDRFSQRAPEVDLARFPLTSLPDPLISSILLNLKTLEELRHLLQVSGRFRFHVLEAIRMLPTLDFTEGLELSNSQLQRLTQLLLAPEEVCVHDFPMDDGDSCSAAHSATCVRPLLSVVTLDFSGCRYITQQSMAGLIAHCPNAEHLYMSKTAIQENQTAHLAYLPKQPLKTLHLGKWTSLHEASTCAAKFQQALPKLGLRQEYEGAGVCDDGGEFDGIYIDVADQKGLTPLLIGCYNGVTSVVQFWLEHGANIESADCFGVNGLMKASYLGHLTIVNLLLARKADTTKQDMYGASALAKAAYRDNADVVERLINEGAGIEAKDMFGNRPLMAAAAAASGGAMGLLLAAGADVNAADNSGRTALTRAVDVGNDSVINSLRSYGALDQNLNAMPTRIG